MNYTIQRISTEQDIEKCNLFEINNYQWKNVYKPKTYGYAGYLEGKGVMQGCGQPFNCFRVPGEYS